MKWTTSNNGNSKLVVTPNERHRMNKVIHDMLMKDEEEAKLVVDKKELKGHYGKNVYWKRQRAKDRGEL